MWSVIGQNKAVSLLQRSLETDSLAHAYLFTGPAHVGKMTLALDIARALNCQAAGPPCGECAVCRKIADGKHADVQVIGLGQNGDSAEAKARAGISIDQIRQMQHAASLPPFEGEYSVFIVDGAELMTTEAANCLLKTLEEPVGKTVFILLTANERLLPATIISRCQRVELSPMSVNEVAAILSKKWGIDPEKAGLLARLAHGCLGWAVSAAVDGVLLEQRNESLDELLELIDGDIDIRFVYAARLAAQFGQNRGQVQERLDLWTDWWRDLMLVKMGLNESVTSIDRLAALVARAEGYSLRQIKNTIESIRAAGEQLKQNANPGLALEALMLNLPEALSDSKGNTAAGIEVRNG